jgi:hypothetical protein
MRRVAGACSAVVFIIGALAIWSQTARTTNAAGSAAVTERSVEASPAAKVAERFPTTTEMFLPLELVRRPDNAERQTVAAAPADPTPPRPRTTFPERVGANTAAFVPVANVSRVAATSCRQDLAAMTARLERALAQARQGKPAADGDACAAYRRDFFEVVKAREVTALCKTGTERVQDLGRIDAAVENINGAIAMSCGT